MTLLEKGNSLFSFLIGDKLGNSLENRLFNAISFLVGSANVIGSLFLLMDEDLFLFYLQLISGLLFLLFYYFSRFKNTFHILYWPFVFVLLVFLFLNTLNNAGTMGGAHYYLIPALVIAIALSGRVRVTVIAVLLVNLATAVLLYIEMYHPQLIKSFTDSHQRILDVAMNFMFAQIFTGVLVLVLAMTLNRERERAESLLLNILPEKIAGELKREQKVEPRFYQSATVLFTDFVGFTTIAEKLPPRLLLRELDSCFRSFDGIALSNHLEKIKTIGDSYMAAGGLPNPNSTHAVDCVLAAFEIQDVMRKTLEEKEEKGESYWQLRLGINTGPLIAGVIGQQKFAYDVWGDTVNTASRLESAGVPGRVNISRATYEAIKEFFECEYRGKIAAKNKGEIDMYFANRILPQLSVDGAGRTPNAQFFEAYNRLGAS